MKNKIKKIINYLIILIMMIPVMVHADNLDEYKLKWTDEGFGTYAYNPLLEADRENFENFVFGSYYVNQSKFYSTLDGYIIVGHNTITKYSRTKGLEETLEYDSMRFIEVDDKFLVISYIFNKDSIKIELMNKELDTLYTKYIKDSYNKYQTIKDDKLVVIYQDTDYKKINSITYDLKDLSIINETSFYTSGYLDSYGFNSEWILYDSIEGYPCEVVFYDSYDNNYILDKDLNLVPYNINDDGTYTVFEKDKLSTYKTDGTLVDEVSLKDANYTLYNVDCWKYNSVYYTVSSEYTYDSTTQKYTNRARFVFYDEKLNVLGTHTINGPVSTSYSYGVYIYNYNNEIIARYNNKYYKINEDFSFTEKNISYAYNNNSFENALTVGDIEVSKSVELQYNTAYYLHYRANEMEDKICEGEADCYAYVDYIYDINYDADKEEVIINVTWEKYKETDSEEIYKQESELIVINDKYNEENPLVIPVIKEIEIAKSSVEFGAILEVTDEYIIVGATVNGTSSIFFYDKYDVNHPLVIPVIKETEIAKSSVEFGAILEVTDEYIIVGATVNGTSSIFFYDKEFNLVKEFSKQETGDKVVQKIDYDNGHIMIIYAEYQYTVPKGIEPVKNDISTNQDASMGTESGPYIPGVNEYGDEYYIEYYEKPYHIETKTDGNGTITSEREIAESGEVIKFTVLPKEGYVLGEIKVTTKTGETIIFTDYEFTMPSADVIIEATFVPENPPTIDMIIIACIILIVSGITLTYMNIKKTRESL